MSTTLSGLYLRERAVWIQPSRAFLPASAAAKPPQVQRLNLLYKKRIGATFRRALWRSGCCHRSTVSAALPTPAGPSVQAVEEPVKRIHVESSVLIQGKCQLSSLKRRLELLQQQKGLALLQDLAGPAATSRTGTIKSSSRCQS